MTSLDAIRERWVRERPDYERLATWVKSELEAALLRRGVKPRVTARAKDVASFVKKALRKRYDDPFARTTDKAGVRVVVPFLRQLASVDAAIHELFVVRGVEDKRDDLGADRMGYASVHYDVELRAPPPTDGALLGRPCEIQARTFCQDVYAEIEHKLRYKAATTMGPEINRRVTILSALLELADREFQLIDDEARGQPGATVYQLQAALEAVYYRFTAAEFDGELTGIVLDAVLPLLGGADAEVVAARLEAFVAAQQPRIEHVFGLYRDVPSPPIFLTQPESLLLFYLLEQDEHRLGERWAEQLPLDELARLATAWGRPISVE